MAIAASCQKKEIDYGEIKVYLEFPESTENNDQIKKEVKDILINTFQEQIQKSYNVYAGNFSRGS